MVLGDDDVVCLKRPTESHKEFRHKFEALSVCKLGGILKLVTRCSKNMQATAAAFVFCADMTFVKLLYLSAMTIEIGYPFQLWAGVQVYPYRHNRWTRPGKPF